MGIVEEELDESLYWMELIVKSNLITQSRLMALMSEDQQLLAMTIASIKTARNKTPRRLS
jgi:four helix bundle protein